MIVFPNAKINLGLYVTSKRPDNYHNLESVFYPIPFHDVLEVLPAEKSRFYSYGLPIPGDEKSNLCVKAWKLLNDVFNIPPVETHLLKNIPMGAGLGGGSSDAAFMLKVLNSMFELSLSGLQLREYALQLGSDCPFFIENTPALAKGRGELLSPVSIPLQSYYISIVFPDIHVSTAQAFAGINPSEPLFDLHRINNLPVSDWKDQLGNDFEKSVFRMHPVIGEIKNELYQKGALYAAMSGSGSAVYGIFDKTLPSDTLVKGFKSRTFRL